MSKSWKISLRRLLLSAAVVAGATACFVPPQGVSVLGNAQGAQCIGEVPLPTIDMTAIDYPGPRLRVVTYNLHSGLGNGFSLWTSRERIESNLRGIAAAIVEASPQTPVDVVGLNEVDFDSRRSYGIDEAKFLARELKQRTGYTYRVVSGETWHRELPGFEVRFGNAVLVRHRLLDTQACTFDTADGCVHSDATTALPRVKRHDIGAILSEPRGAVKVTFEFHGHTVDAVITHLDAFSLTARERQAATLVRNWISARRTTVLLGDINAVPTTMTGERKYFGSDRTHDILTSGRLADARIMYAAQKGTTSLDTWATYPADAPVWPLDGIFGSLDLMAESVVVIGAEQSDHRGLYSSFAVIDDSGRARQQQWHDHIRRLQLARIMTCDVQGSEADRETKIRWLSAGTGFGEVATQAQQRMLNRFLPSLTDQSLIAD